MRTLFSSRNSILKFILSVMWFFRCRVSIIFQKLVSSKIDIARFMDSSDFYLNCIKVNMEKIDCSNIDVIRAETLLGMYLQHRFDLLGSGWVKCDFSDSSNGMDGYRYPSIALDIDSNGEFLSKIMRKTQINKAKRIYSLIDDGYIPIDWQKDYKSGYRWGNDLWFYPRVVASKPGADIKVPWELSRLQHLPRLVILAKVFPEKKDLLFHEFRNELLDFIAQNPVRMGVNHMCTMDVGIRVANIVLACSLWKGMNVEFDKNFESEVAHYLIEECDFIRRNLEWSYYLTSNHYFANIVGLLWGSAAIPKGKKREKWLRFATSELNSEILKQFHEEGSNAEGSTAYHRLTSEMAVYSLALIDYLNQNGEGIAIDARAIKIAGKTGLFSNAIIRPDNMFTQIGDNDSGLFFRLSITGELVTVEEAIGKYNNLSRYVPQFEGEMYLDENLNDCRPFLSAWSGMFDNDDLLYAKKIYPLEASLIDQLVNNRIPVENSINCVETKSSFQKYEYLSSKNYSSEGLNLLENMHRIDFPQFGVYIFKGENVYLAVNASELGQNGNGGHAHNDKLSFELFIGSRCIIEDPGVYVYTALSELRNEFRSTKAHNTIYTEVEQNEYSSLFSMHARSKCELISISDSTICLRCKYADVIHEREIVLSEDGVCIKDYSNKKFISNYIQHRVCRGYGKLLK